jgi:hypothetical protein
MKMYPIVACLAFAVLSAGCQNVQVSQKRGTIFETNADGKHEALTYVSPEEYQRMTPEERDRLNARVGVTASSTLGTSKKK